MGCARWMWCRPGGLRRMNPARRVGDNAGPGRVAGACGAGWPAGGDAGRFRRAGCWCSPCRRRATRRSQRSVLYQEFMPRPRRAAPDLHRSIVGRQPGRSSGSWWPPPGYGLSRYALDVLVRTLVLELLPLMVALFVALRLHAARCGCRGRAACAGATCMRCGARALTRPGRTAAARAGRRPGGGIAGGAGLPAGAAADLP